MDETERTTGFLNSLFNSIFVFVFTLPRAAALLLSLQPLLLLFVLSG